MKDLNCHIQPPEKPLTVGALFDVICDGDLTGFKTDGMALALAQKDKYVFFVKDVQVKSTSEVIFRVTSYVAGDHEIKGLELTSGGEKYALVGIKYHVDSVIDPQNQKPEPYGPFGPLSLTLPLWFWASFAGSVLFAFIVAGLVVWRRVKRRRLFSKIKEFETAQNPFVQLSRELRAWHRKVSTSDTEKLDEALSDLEKLFRAYLTRKFQIPAFQWRMALISKALSQKRVDEKRLQQLKLVFLELEKARRAKTVTFGDAEQLLNLTQKSANDLDLVGSQEKRR